MCFEKYRFLSGSVRALGSPLFRVVIPEGLAAAEIALYRDKIDDYPNERWLRIYDDIHSEKAMYIEGSEHFLPHRFSADWATRHVCQLYVAKNSEGASISGTERQKRARQSCIWIFVEHRQPLETRMNLIAAAIWAQRAPFRTKVRSPL